MTPGLKVFLYWWETNTSEISTHFQSQQLRAKENNEAMIRFSKTIGKERKVELPHQDFPRCMILMIFYYHF